MKTSHIKYSYLHYLSCQPSIYYKADSRLAPSQWETSLLCNDISHWLGTNLDSVYIAVRVDMLSWYHYVVALSAMTTSHNRLDIDIHPGNVTCIQNRVKNHVTLTYYPLRAVLAIPTGLLVRGQQLWGRTRNFLLIFLQFYVYDLRFKAWGPTTCLTEFQTLPERCDCDFKCVNFKYNLGIDKSSIQANITLEWMPEDLADGKSSLVQVMAWCHQAASRCLNQCWPTSLMPCHMASPGHNDSTHWGLRPEQWLTFCRQHF